MERYGASSAYRYKGKTQVILEEKPETTIQSTQEVVSQQFEAIKQPRLKRRTTGDNKKYGRKK